MVKKIQPTDLTQQEIDLVLGYREKQKERARQRKNRVHLLNIAKAYEEWLQDNSRGSSFSTFMDEFGFNGLNSADVFRLVEEIRRTCDHAERLCFTED